MKDISKAIKVFFYKNKLAIFFLAGILLVMTYNFTAYQVKDVEQGLARDILVLNNQEKYEDYYKLDYSSENSYIEEEKFREWEQKEIEKKIEEGFNQEDFEFLRSHSAFIGRNYKIKERQYPQEYNYENNDTYADRWDGFAYSYGFEDMTYENLDGFSAYDFIFENILAEIFFGIILAFILMSFENLTRFHRFIATLPWSKEKTYLSKLIFGTVSILVYMVVSFIVKFMLLNNSTASIFFIFRDSLQVILPSIATVLAILFLTMAAGAFAGNILGQGAVFIVLSMIFIIFLGNTTVIAEMLGNYDISGRINDIYEELPRLVRFIINPLWEHSGNESNLVYDLFLCVFYGALGFVGIRLGDGSNTTKMVQNKYFSNFVKFLSIISTASIFYTFTSLFGVYNSSVFGLVGYLIILVVFRKLFNMLFEVRISI